MAFKMVICIFLVVFSLEMLYLTDSLSEINATIQSVKISLDRLRP